jgi:hypothetical protein
VGVNGYQLFVRLDDVPAVERAIRAYVAEHGASSIVNPDADEPSPDLAERDERTFALSPPEDGWIAVWEDGSWSDRRMARQLSDVLDTEAIWLMLSDVTDSWAYAHYENGEERERAHEQPKDLYGAARRFARKHALPFALEYLPDPNEDADYAEFAKQLDEEGFFDSEPSAEELDAEWDAAETGSDEEVELPEDDAEEEEPAPSPGAGELDAVRDDLVEFSVRVRGRR